MKRFAFQAVPPVISRKKRGFSFHVGPGGAEPISCFAFSKGKTLKSALGKGWGLGGRPALAGMHHLYPVRPVDDAAQHALEARQRTAAGAGPFREDGHVPGAVADEGQGFALQGRQHEFAGLSGRQRLAAQGIDHFRQQIQRLPVQAVAGRAFHGSGKGAFRGAVMLQHRDAPCLPRRRPQVGIQPVGRAEDAGHAGQGRRTAAQQSAQLLRQQEQHAGLRRVRAAYVVFSQGKDLPALVPGLKQHGGQPFVRRHRHALRDKPLPQQIRDALRPMRAGQQHPQGLPGPDEEAHAHGKEIPRPGQVAQAEGQTLGRPRAAGGLYRHHALHLGERHAEHVLPATQIISRGEGQPGQRVQRERRHVLSAQAAGIETAARGMTQLGGEQFPPPLGKTGAQLLRRTRAALPGQPGVEVVSKGGAIRHARPRFRPVGCRGAAGRDRACCRPRRSGSAGRRGSCARRAA